MSAQTLCVMCYRGGVYVRVLYYVSNVRRGGMLPVEANRPLLGPINVDFLLLFPLLLKVKTVKKNTRDIQQRSEC